MTSPPASVSPAGLGAPDPARSPSGPGAPDGFARGGRRHLQGCYADLDGLGSAVAVGKRATTDGTRRKDPA